jgi:hypothetical protein
MLPFRGTQSIIQFKIPFSVWLAIALATGAFVALLIMQGQTFRSS